MPKRERAASSRKGLPVDGNLGDVDDTRASGKGKFPGRESGPIRKDADSETGGDLAAAGRSTKKGYNER